jgi:hypothetical protein
MFDLHFFFVNFPVEIPTNSLHRTSVYANLKPVLAKVLSLTSQNSKTSLMANIDAGQPRPAHWPSNTIARPILLPTQPLHPQRKPPQATNALRLAEQTRPAGPAQVQAKPATGPDSPSIQGPLLAGRVSWQQGCTDSHPSSQCSHPRRASHHDSHNTLTGRQDTSSVLTCRHPLASAHCTPGSLNCVEG